MKIFSLIDRLGEDAGTCIAVALWKYHIAEKEQAENLLMSYILSILPSFLGHPQRRRSLIKRFEPLLCNSWDSHYNKIVSWFGNSALQIDLSCMQFLFLLHELGKKKEQKFVLNFAFKVMLSLCCIYDRLYSNEDKSTQQVDTFIEEKDQLWLEVVGENSKDPTQIWTELLYIPYAPLDINKEIDFQVSLKTLALTDHTSFRGVAIFFADSIIKISAMTSKEKNTIALIQNFILYESSLLYDMMRKNPELSEDNARWSLYRKSYVKSLIKKYKNEHFAEIYQTIQDSSIRGLHTLLVSLLLLFADPQQKLWSDKLVLRLMSSILSVLHQKIKKIDVVRVRDRAYVLQAWKVRGMDFENVNLPEIYNKFGKFFHLFTNHSANEIVDVMVDIESSNFSIRDLSNRLDKCFIVNIMNALSDQYGLTKGYGDIGYNLIEIAKACGMMPLLEKYNNLLTALMKKFLITDILLDTFNVNTVFSVWFRALILKKMMINYHQYYKLGAEKYFQSLECDPKILSSVLREAPWLCDFGKGYNDWVSKSKQEMEVQLSCNKILLKQQKKQIVGLKTRNTDLQSTNKSLQNTNSTLQQSNDRLKKKEFVFIVARGSIC